MLLLCSHSFHNYQITHSVPAPVEVAQTIEGTLDGGEFSFFQFLLPTMGMTLRLQTQRGRVVVYADDSIQNPNAAFYDYKLETGSNSEVYIDPGALGIDHGTRKRQASADATETTIYVSLEGIDESNSFELESNVGDTCKWLETACSYSYNICIIQVHAVVLLQCSYV